MRSTQVSTRAPLRNARRRDRPNAGTLTVQANEEPDGPAAESRVWGFRVIQSRYVGRLVRHTSTQSTDSASQTGCTTAVRRRSPEAAARVPTTPQGQSRNPTPDPQAPPLTSPRAATRPRPRPAPGFPPCAPRLRA